MSQAIQEGAIAVQILNLKKAYEPMRNKTISFDNAKKLQGIFAYELTSILCLNLTKEALSIFVPILMRRFLFL